jgi:ABC-type transport system involved in cytochrome c biogenesis permease subunit
MNFVITLPILFLIAYLVQKANLIAKQCRSNAFTFRTLSRIEEAEILEQKAYDLDMISILGFITTIIVQIFFSFQ